MPPMQICPSCNIVFRHINFDLWYNLQIDRFDRIDYMHIRLRMQICTYIYKLESKNSCITICVCNTHNWLKKESERSFLVSRKYGGDKSKWSSLSWLIKSLNYEQSRKAYTSSISHACMRVWMRAFKRGYVRFDKCVWYNVILHSNTNISSTKKMRMSTLFFCCLMFNVCLLYVCFFLIFITTFFHLYPLNCFAYATN